MCRCDKKLSQRLIVWRRSYSAPFQPFFFSLSLALYCLPRRGWYTWCEFREHNEATKKVSHCAVLPPIFSFVAVCIDWPGQRKFNELAPHLIKSNHTKNNNNEEERRRKKRRLWHSYLKHGLKRFSSTRSASTEWGDVFPPLSGGAIVTPGGVILQWTQCQNIYKRASASPLTVFDKRTGGMGQATLLSLVVSPNFFRQLCRRLLKSFSSTCPTVSFEQNYPTRFWVNLKRGTNASFCFNARPSHNCSLPLPVHKQSE